MSSFYQSELMNQKPVILNNMNIKAPEGEPTFLSFDEVSTMFHEMGHALHGCSLMSHILHCGTSVSRDARVSINFPGRLDVNEKVINNFAKHYETGEQIARNC